MDREATLNLFREEFPGTVFDDKFFTDVNSVKVDERPLLSLCIYRDRNDLVDKLIELGVDVNYKDGAFSPLMSAIYHHIDNTNMILSLLNAGADSNLVTRQGSPLSMIFEYKSHPNEVDIDYIIEIVKILMSYGANINYDDGDIKSCLLYYILQTYDHSKYKLIKFLFENGLDISRSPYPWMVILIDRILSVNEYSEADNLRIMRLFIEYGVSVDINSGKRYPLLILASNMDGILYDDLDKLTLMLLMGKPFIGKKEKDDVLPWIIRTNKILSITYMLENNIIDEQDLTRYFTDTKYKFTLLQLAEIQDDKTIYELLSLYSGL